jgi:hypothetical protein
VSCTCLGGRRPAAGGAGAGRGSSRIIGYCHTRNTRQSGHVRCQMSVAAAVRRRRRVRGPRARFMLYATV